MVSMGKNETILENKRITVTGGAGFLGKHLVEELKHNGANNIFVPKHPEYDFTQLNDCKKI